MPMKYLFLIILISFFFTSCADGDKNATANLDLVEKYVKAVEDLDYEAMASLLADDYVGYAPSYGDSILRDHAVESWKSNVENLYESIKYNKSRNVAVTIKAGENKGDWVSNWGELHIVYKNGDDVTIWANSIYKIENGKIAKSYTFYNEADALRQLGYVIVKPEDLN